MDAITSYQSRMFKGVDPDPINPITVEIQAPVSDPLTRTQAIREATKKVGWRKASVRETRDAQCYDYNPHTDTGTHWLIYLEE